MLLSFTKGARLGKKSRARAPRHTIGDITAASISCGSMDSSCSYSFYAHLCGDIWLFDADCFADGNTCPIAMTDRQLEPNDTKELLSLLERTDTELRDVCAGSFKRRARASDGDTYAVCLTFADGDRLEAFGRQKGLEALCYRLAEKYNIIN